MTAKMSIIIFTALAGVSLVQEGAIIEITGTRSVHFIVKDPLGRRTGRDPRGSSKPWIGTALQEIPNANYSTNAIGDSRTEIQPSEDDIQHEFMYEAGFPEDYGRYLIDAIGIKPGLYSIYVTVSLRIDSVQPFHAEFRGLIDKDSSRQYRLELSSQQGARTSLEKVPSWGAIRIDINVGYEVGLLGDKDLYKDLTHRLDKFEKYLAHKDSSKAREELEDFKDKIEDVRKQTVKKEQKKERREKEFLTKDAYQILQEDVDALLKQLPQRRKGKGWDHDDRDRP